MARFSIFISYRRTDTPDAAGVLYDALASNYGEPNVFMDVELQPGTRYAEVIMERVQSSDVLIALIGPNWLTASDEDGRRLDDPDDLLRREITAALERGATVIPVLAGNAEMPKPAELPDDLKVIPTIHSFRLGLGREYRSERERLIAHLDRIRDRRPGRFARLSRFVRTRTQGGPSPAPRRRLLQSAAALLLLVAAIAVGYAVAGRGTTKTDTNTGASVLVSADTAYPDAIESELLIAHIPRALRDHCSRIPPIAASVFLRSVRCSQGADGGTVTYSRAHSGDALRAYFLQQAESAGTTFPSHGRSCRGMPSSAAADEWTRQGLQTHLEGGPGRAEGRVLCYTNSADETFVWTDTPTKILAEASRPVANRAALYQWWRDRAGPEKELPVMTAMSAMGPWPDALETELLLEHLPPAIEKTCHRSPADYEDQVFLRGVTCTQVSGGGTVEYLYAHSGSALNDFVTQRIGAIGLNGPEGSCARQATAASPWSRVAAIGHRESGRSSAQGRVVCSIDQSGNALLEWSDVPTGIYARATRPRSARAALYSWWQMRAGPGELEGSMGSMGAAPAPTTTAPMMTTDTSPSMSDG